MELLIYSGAQRWQYAVNEPPAWVARGPELRGDVRALSGSGGDLIALDTPMYQLEDGRPNGHVSCLIIGPGDIVVAW